LLNYDEAIIGRIINITTVTIHLYCIYLSGAYRYRAGLFNNYSA